MNIEVKPHQAEKAAQLLNAMSNPHRLRVLCELHAGELMVGDLQDRIGISQSNLSQQLARLRRDGLVSTRRESQKIFYTLASDEVVQLIHLLHELFCKDADV
ncbi:MAG: winged helix-turn-helix transcriptional regulator [Alphaproteobacteria bacterium]|jgi:DNA-binding transcriptional ArsR family regulator|nr:winged helix-turn-helix transcriptional regulator [Alphaproteobacteria bacterium]MBO6628830.1 winged helix-turn-helix transcriptional regulator [Alphaproteobacteria bacterium]MDF1627288.1 metalloregulator ArsR/SmtB family transcription factor [Parvibaculaceae bacterium]